MKRIAMLTCLNSTAVCSSGGCFRAFNNRDKTFEIYKNEDVELCAFFHCNGCDCDYENDEAFNKKLDRIISMNLDAVHKGVCTFPKGKECEVIKKISERLEKSGIKIIQGTH
ncbi:MAG: CGGC domain-containing protein [Lachnospiraceae bacterium]|jgi:predicted metal-binding protein|nr:CGGC domain-containing protein [Lachnospiraceae bacterium]